MVTCNQTEKVLLLQAITTKNSTASFTSSLIVVKRLNQSRYLVGTPHTSESQKREKKAGRLSLVSENILAKKSGTLMYNIAENMHLFNSQPR